MSGIIKISELGQFPVAITADDFFPIDKSSSLLTYRVNVGQLQTFLSTGSFLGSLIGTSSWANNAVSASYAITSSYSLNSNSSSYSLTASYAANSAASLTGTGTAEYFTKWASSNTLSDAEFYYDTINFTNVASKNLNVFKNTPKFTVTGSGQAFASVIGDFNSTLTLASATTSSDAFVIICEADKSDTWTTQWGRGAIEMSSFTSSNNFVYNNSRSYTGDNLPNGQIRMLRIRSNGWYFWPLGGVQSISRDGTVNIGVDSGTENHETRFKIAVYSGSSAAPQTVDHLKKAIEVTYGSGSAGNWPVTFCVSSSGKTYIGGELQVNGGVILKSANFDSVATTPAQQMVYIDSATASTRFINLGNHATASITMSQGSQLNVVVNQASTATTASLLFKGAMFSGSVYYDCPIVWRNGTQPSVSSGSYDRADFFTFVAVNTSNLGPKGSGAPNNTVIYGTVVQNMY